MKVVYLPLESYRERYTEQLKIWTLNELTRLGFEVEVITGSRLTGESIEVGRVLDAYGRGHFACTQTANLIKRMRDGGLGSEDVIYIDDMFHPGWEAIPYILAQLPPAKRPRLFTRCWAQSVDPHDFTFPMRKWMRRYEMMVDSTAAGIFVGATCHKEEMQAAGFEAPIHVVGLPLQPDEVLERAGVEQDGYLGLLLPAARRRRVVFTSRWDTEKNPMFYLAMAAIASKDKRFEGVEFAVTTSAKKLRSNDGLLVLSARAAQAKGVIKVYEDLSKVEYYRMLASSLVQFNCAYQDYVSWTLLEASTFGTPTLAPSFRSFPEALFGNPRQLYVPWSAHDALDRLASLIDDPLPLDVVRAPVDYHRRGFERMAQVFSGHSE